MAFPIRSILLATVVLTCACSGDTPLDEQFQPGVDALQSGSQRCDLPATGTPPADGVHPDLTHQVAIPLDNTPFAVAVSRSGVAYVTQLHGGTASRADLSFLAFSAPFDVGALPSQVRMSPDGQTAYVGNQNSGTITYVDVTTNQATGSASIPQGSILTIGLAPDGSRLYALMDFYGVYVIDVATQQVVDSIPVDKTGTLLTGVAFHPFSSCMYIAARDQGKVSVVDLRTNRVVRTHTVAGARIQNVAVSPDGASLFATDIQRSKLLVWDLTRRNADPLEYAVGTPVNRNAFDVAVTPDNTQLYVSTLADGKVFVLDRSTRSVLSAIVTGGSARYIGFDATGAMALVPNESGWVTFAGTQCVAPGVGTAPGGAGHPGMGHEAVPLDGLPFAVAISAGGTAYVTRLLAASAVRADLPSTSFSAPFPVGDLPSQVRISPDGGTAFVGNQDARTISFVDVATNTITGTLAVPGGSILTLGLSPDGRRLYALTDFTGVFVIDTETRTVVGEIPASSTGSLLTGVAFHPFAPCMYVAARDAGRITTVDLRANKVVRAQTVAGGRIQNLAVSKDGALLFATDIERSKLLVRDLTLDGSAFLEYAVGTPVSRNAFDVAVTPDNALVYVTTLADGAIFVFDRATRALQASIVTGGSPRYVGFDAGGTTAVVPNESGWVSFVR